MIYAMLREPISLLHRLDTASLCVLPPISLDGESEGDREILSRLQRFRGSVYLGDGAIPATDLDHEGRHWLAGDESSWHIYLSCEDGEILGCMRMTPYSNRTALEKLRSYEFLCRMSPEDAAGHRDVIQKFLDWARASRRPYWEPGGWAVHPDHQNGGKGLVLGCSCWSLGQLHGGVVGLSFANARSAALLRKLGCFSPFKGDAPSVYDRHHGRGLELVAFDSTRPAPALEAAVEEIRDFIAGIDLLSSASY